MGMYPEYPKPMRRGHEADPIYAHNEKQEADFAKDGYRSAIEVLRDSPMEFPKWLYGPGGDSVLVANRQEENEHLALDYQFKPTEMHMKREAPVPAIASPEEVADLKKQVAQLGQLLNQLAAAQTPPEPKLVPKRVKPPNDAA
jgi:hypothetical protein